MLVPHSERKTFNFQINLFSMLFLSVLLSGIVLGFFFLTTHYTGTSRLLSLRTTSLENSEASLEVLRDEIAELQKVARVFESTLSNTLSALGLEEGKAAPGGNARGDLASFFGVEEVQEGALREIAEVQSLRNYLKSTIEPMNEISTVLLSQKELLIDIPTRWPLKGVRGRITNNFGPSIHPFTGQWYLHKGIDIAYGYNIPIISTARGKVVDVNYEPMGFGWFVLIRHKYGFYTKYAHLDKVIVKKGQEVHQGQIVGTMGSSGLSTGPHLHYEVRIGAQVVDPGKFLSISSSLAGLSGIK